MDHPFFDEESSLDQEKAVKLDTETINKLLLYKGTPKLKTAAINLLIRSLQPE
jgi:hypothetical protein